MKTSAPHCYGNTRQISETYDRVFIMITIVCFVPYTAKGRKSSCYNIIQFVVKVASNVCGEERLCDEPKECLRRRLWQKQTKYDLDEGIY